MTTSTYGIGNHVCTSPLNEACFLKTGAGMLVGATLVALASSLFTTVSNLSGSMVIVGKGPELHTIERLARAFEEANPEIGVEIRWDRNSKRTEAVESGVADIGVAGQAHAGLAAVAIAWDGIAVIVNKADPVKEVSREQLVAMYSERVTRWAELQTEQQALRASDRSVEQKRILSLGELDPEIRLIHRAPDQSTRQSFEEFLGIAGYLPKSATIVETDQQAISEVAGNLSAVAYLSFGVVLEARKAGTSVRVLRVDHIEATERNVREGQYTLRRPVLLLSRSEPNLLIETFIAFTLSDEEQAIVEEQFIPYSAPTPSFVRHEGLQHVIAEERCAGTSCRAKEIRASSWS
jgi:phosphate transport system substrate-binding protein